MGTWGMGSVAQGERKGKGAEARTGIAPRRRGSELVVQRMKGGRAIGLPGQGRDCYPTLGGSIFFDQYTTGSIEVRRKTYVYACKTHYLQCK